MRYNQRAIEHKLVDQQVRSVDVGKVQVGIGSIYRGKLGQATGAENIVAEAVAEHEQVSEVYYVIEGSATLLDGAGPRGPEAAAEHAEDRARTEWSRLQRRFDQESGSSRTEGGRHDHHPGGNRALVHEN